MKYNSTLFSPRINLAGSPDSATKDSWTSGFLTPVCTLRCDSRTLQSVATVGASVIQTWSDPLEALRWMSQTFWPGKGRWIGYLSYDLGRLFEQLPQQAADDLNLPLFAFTYCRPVGERIYAPEPEYGLCHQKLQSNFTRPQYESAVARAIEFIRAGDVFQVNLSQRFSVGMRVHPALVYQQLLRNSPGRYAAYLGLGDFAILSNSPELFFRVTPDRKIITCPIKGTRPASPGMREELLHSEKDKAELNMIVDIERNDLGRVCTIPSVRVTAPRVIESHPTLFHGVATIEGTLRDDVTFVDLLRAIFPGGSVTGAPKIRAMQIIDELEPVRRGPYCGAIGYIAADGSMEFNVAIRTIIVKDGLAYIPVGGGIVADSQPAAEFDETLVKAQAMFAALGIQSNGDLL